MKSLREEGPAEGQAEGHTEDAFRFHMKTPTPAAPTPLGSETVPTDFSNNAPPLRLTSLVTGATWWPQGEERPSAGQWEWADADQWERADADQWEQTDADQWEQASTDQWEWASTDQWEWADADQWERADADQWERPETNGCLVDNKRLCTRGSGIWSYTCRGEEAVPLLDVSLRPKSVSVASAGGALPAGRLIHRRAAPNPAGFKAAIPSPAPAPGKQNRLRGRETIAASFFLKKKLLFVVSPPPPKPECTESAGAILLVSVPATIMTSDCRGLARNTTPKRSMSYRGAAMCIISTAQHARPKVMGHIEP
ncbi:hypothetical protein EYF80_048956 [Liparis tanakae]|uniref:Uncharacterized protein n=1 Tax=Liparis tanakae TaxID=230148 RepID=A0A4Z2FI37_9TELE|nr:hypothetical protein EYF80_048956 [Liparis tanakae]